MSRLFGILSVLVVLLVAMGFAAVNAGNRVTLSLGFVTLYQVPVTLVAFSGLFVGMLAMFAAGIHSDLKVRKILRDRLAEETRREQTGIDRNQQDLFDVDEEREAKEGELESPAVSKSDAPIEPHAEASDAPILPNTEASPSSRLAEPRTPSPEPEPGTIVHDSDKES